ncbi:hypothetical protein HXX76_016236 [Chlamydomonas incerta]|uniref:Sushi domain-containing protein n=1 Tax=Chlamydomonas incerta TaxID=51695 RepID=A0A835VM98_CHLIN|nr:hypothetical protein HXX76_016236 [Chlamydomonas incerta]|eukprot:KAG2422157.1 hypothetical protein HXX76_016236 [Chlamydomonas incerta]
MGGLLLLVAITALATVDARKTGFGGRHLLQSCPASNFCADIFTNCFDISCPNGILTVTAKNAGVTFQPDGRTNAYTCKSAYSWYACAQPGGASCTGVKTGSGRVACTPSGGLKTSGNGDYCNEPSVGRFDTTQATGLTDAVIQIHDGSFQGSASSTCPLTGDTTVEASGPCWSGGASDCKVCEKKIDAKALCKPSPPPSPLPKYLTLSGAEVHTFLASASSPAAEARGVLHRQLLRPQLRSTFYVVSIPTDTTNFACLTCSWFRVYVVAGQCRCGSDTAGPSLVYQSYVPPPTMAPGQFQRFSPYTTPSLPFGYGATLPSRGPGGVYVAIHMSVGGGFCDGLPAYN